MKSNEEKLEMHHWFDSSVGGFSEGYVRDTSNFKRVWNGNKFLTRKSLRQLSSIPSHTARSIFYGFSPETALELHIDVFSNINEKIFKFFVSQTVSVVFIDQFESSRLFDHERDYMHQFLFRETNEDDDVQNGIIPNEKKGRYILVYYYPDKSLWKEGKIHPSRRIEQGELGGSVPWKYLSFFSRETSTSTFQSGEYYVVLNKAFEGFEDRRIAKSTTCFSLFKGVVVTDYKRNEINFLNDYKRNFGDLIIIGGVIGRVDFFVHRGRKYNNIHSDSKILNHIWKHSIEGRMRRNVRSFSIALRNRQERTAWKISNFHVFSPEFQNFICFFLLCRQHSPELLMKLSVDVIHYRILRFLDPFDFLSIMNDDFNWKRNYDLIKSKKIDLTEQQFRKCVDLVTRNDSSGTVSIRNLLLSIEYIHLYVNDILRSEDSSQWIEAGGNESTVSLFFQNYDINEILSKSLNTRNGRSNQDSLDSHNFFEFGVIQCVIRTLLSVTNYFCKEHSGINHPNNPNETRSSKFEFRLSHRLLSNLMTIHDPQSRKEIRKLLPFLVSFLTPQRIFFLPDLEDEKRSEDFEHTLKCNSKCHSRSTYLEIILNWIPFPSFEVDRMIDQIRNIITQIIERTKSYNKAYLSQDVKNSTTTNLVKSDELETHHINYERINEVKKNVTGIFKLFITASSLISLEGKNHFDPIIFQELTSLPQMFSIIKFCFDSSSKPQFEEEEEGEGEETETSSFHENDCLFFKKRNYYDDLLVEEFLRSTSTWITSYQFPTTSSPTTELIRSSDIFIRFFDKFKLFEYLNVYFKDYSKKEVERNFRCSMQIIKDGEVYVNSRQLKLVIDLFLKTSNDPISHLEILERLFFKNSEILYGIFVSLFEHTKSLFLGDEINQKLYKSIFRALDIQFDHNVESNCESEKSEVVPSVVVSEEEEEEEETTTTTSMSASLRDRKLNILLYCIQKRIFCNYFMFCLTSFEDGGNLVFFSGNYSILKEAQTVLQSIKNKVSNIDYHRFASPSSQDNKTIRNDDEFPTDDDDEGEKLKNSVMGGVDVLSEFVSSIIAKKEKAKPEEMKNDETQQQQPSEQASVEERRIEEGQLQGGQDGEGDVENRDDDDTTDPFVFNNNEFLLDNTTTTNDNDNNNHDHFTSDPGNFDFDNDNDRKKEGKEDSFDFQPVLQGIDMTEFIPPMKEFDFSSLAPMDDDTVNSGGEYQYLKKNENYEEEDILPLPDFDDDDDDDKSKKKDDEDEEKEKKDDDDESWW